MLFWVEKQAVNRSALEVLAHNLNFLLPISSVAIVLRICLNKFNAERHLAIVYSHRVAVLSQYNAFERQLKDDHEAINDFRLEVVRMVFGDPVTGYANEAHSEINFSPVLKAIRDRRQGILVYSCTTLHEIHSSVSSHSAERG